MKENESGMVFRNTGSSYIVRTAEGEMVDCKIKGKFRIKGIKSTNPVAVGDIVKFVRGADGGSLITEICDRRNYVVRKPSNLSKQLHIIAANVDQAVLIVTVRHPETSTTFIDRFLATCEAYRVPAVICINKTDLLDEEDREYVNALRNLYEGIGYGMIETSAMQSGGAEPLSKLLEGKITLLSGNSGVGKSSLINAINPDFSARTGEISTAHDTGMHTTTFSEMYELSPDTFIIDTPGIKGFGTIDFDKREVGHFFPEIFNIAKDCRFGDCTHTHEPGCAVLEALDEHRISQSRYTSYLSIMQDSDEGKYRERF